MNTTRKPITTQIIDCRNCVRFCHCRIAAVLPRLSTLHLEIDNCNAYEERMS